MGPFWPLSQLVCEVLSMHTDIGHVKLGERLEGTETDHVQSALYTHKKESAEKGHICGHFMGSLSFLHPCRQTDGQTGQTKQCFLSFSATRLKMELWKISKVHLREDTLETRRAKADNLRRGEHASDEDNFRSIQVR